MKRLPKSDSTSARAHTERLVPVLSSGGDLPEIAHDVPCEKGKIESQVDDALFLADMFELVQQVVFDAQNMRFVFPDGFGIEPGIPYPAFPHVGVRLFVLQESLVTSHQCAFVPRPLDAFGPKSVNGRNRFHIANVNLSGPNANKISMLLMQPADSSMILASPDREERPEFSEGRPERPWKLAASMEESSIDADGQTWTLDISHLASIEVTPCPRCSRLRCSDQGTRIGRRSTKDKIESNQPVEIRAAGKLHECSDRFVSLV